MLIEVFHSINRRLVWRRFVILSTRHYCTQYRMVLLCLVFWCISLLASLRPIRHYRVIRWNLVQITCFTEILFTQLYQLIRSFECIRCTLVQATAVRQQVVGNDVIFAMRTKSRKTLCLPSEPNWQHCTNSRGSVCLSKSHSSWYRVPIAVSGCHRCHLECQNNSVRVPIFAHFPGE